MTTPSEALAEAETRPEKRCAICNTPRTEHAELVAAGELHHRFSEQGELVQQAQKRPEARKVVAQGDLALRLALLNAGVITNEQLLRAEAALREISTAGGRGSGGDREDREAEGTERGGRPPSTEESPGERENSPGTTQPE